MKKKMKKDSPRGWVDDLKKKLSDWNASQKPEKTPKEDWPTYASERARRMKEGEPTGTAFTATGPDTEEEEEEPNTQ